MKLKELYRVLIDRETWKKVGELNAFDPNKKSLQYKRPFVQEGYEAAFVITMVLSLAAVAFVIFIAVLLS